MLCFAAVTPHPPVLIPSIGKDEIEKVKKTKAAMEKLNEELYACSPQVIIIISPHTGLYDNCFAINAHTHFETNFAEFGDLTTKKKWNGAPEMAADIAHVSRHALPDIQLISEHNLDHGATVPLYQLTANLPDVKILPIGYSRVCASDHIFFGEMLKDVIMESSKKIAVIASGDLAHGLEKDHGAEKKAFDKELIKHLTNRSVANFMQLEEKALKVDECGYRSILILLGIIKNMDYKFNAHCYEHPFDVGYLTGNFEF
jgi:MEMO1 family protein